MIIGIAGNANVGKDTLVNIFNYVDDVGYQNAKYREWLIKYTKYKPVKYKNVTHFADALKDNIANIFNISRGLLDDRYYKDNLWFVPSTGEFISNEQSNKILKITENNIYYYKHLPKEKYCIKLRQIIQLYAEEIKSLFGDDIWIKNTINKANNILNYEHQKYCLIGDVRFHNEVDAIKKNNGIIIKITRKDNNIILNHCSENNEFDFDYIIENDNTLYDFYFKSLCIYQETIKKL